MDGTRARKASTQHYLVSPPEAQNWQALQIFSLFRIILVISCWILTKYNWGPAFLGQENPFWFLITTNAYLAIAAVALICSAMRIPDYDLQTNVPIFFDIFFILLWTHLSGGISTGLGLLLIIITAAHSLLAPILFASCGAAIATCSILAGELYRQISLSTLTPSFSQAGLLGLSIFVTAIVANALKKRTDTMQQLAFQRGQKLATALQLNAQVVSFMQEGVIVFDQNNHVQLINSASLRLLALSSSAPLKTLSDFPIRFQQALIDLKQKDDPIFQITKASPEIRLTQSILGRKKGHVGLVVFIHDVSKESKKAQHMKLALLGNLAANIAHEIRNPLSTVSHASQLLQESTRLNEEDHQMLQMIRDNCNRMNTVIKNVLELSKKQVLRSEVIELNSMVKEFIESFKPSTHAHADIAFFASESPLSVYLDPSQLKQMMVNICENGIRYSLRQIQQPKLTIILKSDDDNHRAQLHIIDYGSGVDGRDLKHLFEPFYTTEKQGSGLGLYISKQLCQMHGGELYYEKADTGGSDFSIVLPLYEEIQHESA